MALLADAVAPALLVAQAIGRLGNWFNQELYGGQTTLPWGLQIDGSDALYHPTFLYELIWNLIGAALIICSECADGIGGDSFYQALKGCKDAASLLEEIRTIPMDRTIPDQWQYQILARILERHHVYFVAKPELREVITEMKMEYVPSLEEAYRRARAEKGEQASLTVIPNGISLIIQR